MNSIFKRIVTAVLCLIVCCSGLATWVHADTDAQDHVPEMEVSQSSSCSHKYAGEGVCSKCGYVYQWTLNSADAGKYYITVKGNGKQPHIGSPYGDAGYDTSVTFKAGNEVTVKGSLENAYGNKWYQISYGSGKTGYLFSDYLQKCSHSYKKETKEATCQADGKVTFTCSKCAHTYSETIKSTGNEHSYGSMGVCKHCKVTFAWTLNKADAGMYIAQDFCSPRTKGPYTESATDYLGSITKGTRVKVNGSVINAFGEKWYQVQYGNNETGYLQEVHLKPCPHDYETKVTKEATCKEDGQKTHTCKVCGYVYEETVKATGVHKYGLDGKCTWCGTAYVWKLNTADAGYYLTTKQVTVATEPYLAVSRDPATVYAKDQAVKVIGSLINAHSSKWYQISYGSGKIGYLAENELTPCMHTKYNSSGVCATCGYEFQWKLNTGNAGTYTAVDTFNPWVKPYEAAKKDTNTSFVKGNGVKVTGSLTNAFGNQWYQISYGNGKTGYVQVSKLILCSHSYNTQVTKEATCAAEGSKTHTCSKCSYSYKETVKKLSHTWTGATCTAPKTCAVCGVTEGDLLPHTYDGGKCTVCGAVEKSEVLFGDANGDGVVNAKDAMLVLQYYTKKIDASKLNTSACDVDGNNAINAKDAMLILQKYTKKITAFPIEVK